MYSMLDMSGIKALGDSLNGTKRPFEKLKEIIIGDLVGNAKD
jgi:hypothetical protein